MAKYKDKNIGIDDSVFQQRVVKLARKFKVDEKQFIKDQSRLLARDAARFTPPYIKFPDWQKGTAIGSKADIEHGEWAIDRDIRRICMPLPDDVVWREHRKSKGGPIYRRKGRSNEIVAPMAIVNAFTLHRWHRDNKNAWGRTQKLKRPGLPWVPESLVEEYIKNQQGSAGMAKACFFKASLGFGGKSTTTPKIKRHVTRANGSGKLVKTRNGYDGLIQARAEGIRHTISKLPHLRRNRIEKANKRLEILAKAAAKKAGFKVV